MAAERSKILGNVVAEESTVVEAANRPPLIPCAAVPRLASRRAQDVHKNTSIYRQGKKYPHPHELYKLFPQSKRIRWGVEASFHTSAFFLVREGFLDDEASKVLRALDTKFRRMVDEVPRQEHVDFTGLSLPHLGWESQDDFDDERRRKATACAAYYGNEMGLLGRYIAHEYTGKWRNEEEIKQILAPFLLPEDIEQVQRTLRDGCPADFDWEEPHENKMLFLERGNNTSLDRHPQIVHKTLVDELNNHHLLMVDEWVVYFSASAHHVPQSIIVRKGSKCTNLYSDWTNIRTYPLANL